MNKGSPDIITLDTRVVYENRWMRVREDSIRLRDGSESIFGVVEKPECAIILPIENEGSLYLVEQYRYPVGARYWELPQGSWGFIPEVDPVELARGELLEETGLQATSVEKLGYLYPACGYASQGCHVFVATGLSRTQSSPELEEQDLIAGKFSLAKVKEMVRQGEIRDATTIAALGLAHFKAVI